MEDAISVLKDSTLWNESQPLQSWMNNRWLPEIHVNTNSLKSVNTNFLTLQLGVYSTAFPFDTKINLSVKKIVKEEYQSCHMIYCRDGHMHLKILSSQPPYGQTMG